MKILRIAFLVVTLFACSIAPAQTQRKSRGWENTKGLVGSTPQGVLKGAKALGVEKGQWLIVSLSTQCQDCDRTALALNQRTDTEHILGITADPAPAATTWKQKLGLKFRVMTISDEIFRDFGLYLLPTVVLLQNGVAVAAREDVPRDEKDVPNLPAAPPASKPPATRRN